MRYFLTLTVVLGLVALPASMAVAGLQATVTAENNGSPHSSEAGNFQEVSDGVTTDNYWGPPSATGYGGLSSAFADRWSFDMDLGSDAAVTSISYWNYNGQNAVDLFTLEYATDAEGAGNYNQSLTADQFGTETDTNGSPGVLTGVEVQNGFSDSLATLDFAGGPATKTFRYVRFTWDSNAGGNFVGMKELQFNGTLVPEPSTLLLSLLGLTGLMAIWRRRNRG